MHILYIHIYPNVYEIYVYKAYICIYVYMCTVCIYLYKLNVYTYIHIHNTYFLKETPEAFGKVLSIYCMWRTLKRRHTHTLIKWDFHLCSSRVSELIKAVFSPHCRMTNHRFYNMNAFSNPKISIHT